MTLTSSLAKTWTLSNNFTIIGGAVFDNKFHRFTEFLPWWIQSFTHVLPQCLKVHGPGDDLVVILHNLGINRCVEGIRLHKTGQVRSNYNREEWKQIITQVKPILHWDDPSCRWWCSPAQMTMSPWGLCVYGGWPCVASVKWFKRLSCSLAQRMSNKPKTQNKSVLTLR